MAIKTVDSATLKRWLDNNEAVLIDVREPAENQAESIAGATLLPLADVAKQALPETSGKKLVIHCRSGKRGGDACKKLLAEDPNLEIYNLEGGISAWTEGGYNVQKSKGFFLPLDQQVQLTIGLCVLTGSLLTYFVNPLFAIFTAFFGVGLTFAGLTGFCGLAMIMAKMTWNQKTSKDITSCYNRVNGE